MENYIVSARKYRPTSFKEVIGQTHITTTLQNAIKNDHLAHSFLFCGPRGVGKTTCARVLAKTINCENLGSDIEPCNECASCTSFNTSTSFNIHELDAASNNKVEDIRQLIDQVRVPPPSGKYKIYIIDEVHMLSSQAFNAFLKTLEEPPAHTIFILATTEKHKIIATILSRCQIFDFKRIPIPLLVKNMQEICAKEGVEANDNALHIIAQKADGSVRDTLSMLDRMISFSGDTVTYEDVLRNLSVLDYDYFFKATDSLLSQDIPSALLLLDEILEMGFDCDDFNLGLSEHFRNLLVCKDQRTEALLEVSGQLKERYLNQSEIAPLSFLLNGLKFMNECDVQNRMSQNRRLTVELTLMKMVAISRLQEFPTQTQGIVDHSGVKKTDVKGENKKKPVVSSKKDNTKEPSTTETGSETGKKEITAKKVEDPDKNIINQEKNISITKTRKIGKLDHIYADVEKKIINEKENPKEKRRYANEQSDISSINEKELHEVWFNYGEVLKKQKRKSIVNLVESFQPKIVDNKIQLVVESSIQKELLTNEESKLLMYLCKELNLPSINFEFVVDKSATEKTPKIPYTSREKYDKVVDKNPTVQELKNRLGLELEF